MLTIGFLLVCAAIGVVALATGPAAGVTGVARSLQLIDAHVGDRQVPRSELPARERLLVPVLETFEGLATLLSPGGTQARIRRQLDRAGNPIMWSPQRVLGAKGASLAVGVILGPVYGGISIGALLLSLALGGALFFLPDLLLYNAALRRQQATATGMAEALDMLTVCVEAGQGFDASLGQVCRNIDGPIAGEFARVLSEIQIGKARSEAFAAMGKRINSPDVRAFVTALVQADRLGLPIANVLREQTAAMRVTRRQKAEEQAQKVTVKILFPLLLCILPTLMVVVIGPGAIRLTAAFAAMGGG